MTYTLLNSDVSDVNLESNSFDALLSDPPYGISMMGRDWDRVVPPADTWRKLAGALKPGAPLLVFGGTRTWHRLAVALEDAGLEVRDSLMWVYGQGFPKSMDVSKAIDKAAGAERRVLSEKVARVGFDPKGEGGGGWQAGVIRETEPATDLAKLWEGYGTALKPAWEPIILARKPLDGTVAENVSRWGCGALNIDACRIGTEPMRKTASDGTMVSGNRAMSGGNTGRVDAGVATGRFPANLLLDEAAAAELDAQTGERRSTLTGRADPSGSYRNPSEAEGQRIVYSGPGGGGNVYADAGGASRFFYVPKVSRKERGEGNLHPTLKPIALTEYLARLILPPCPTAGGTAPRLLVPFSGSGSEMIGALRAGWTDVTGIEREAEFCEIARKRLG